MGLTAKELLGGVVVFGLVLIAYQLITLSLLLERNGASIGWCNSLNTSGEVYWWVTGWTGLVLLFSFIFGSSAIISVIKASNEVHTSSYRKSKLFSVLAIVTYIWALYGLYYDVGMARGQARALMWQNHTGYCAFSIPSAVYATFLGCVLSLPLQVLLYNLSKTMIRSLDPEAPETSLLDSTLSMGRRTVSCVRKLRRRLPNAVFWAKRYAKSSIRVKRQHDDIFREVDFSTLLLKSYTLQELKEAIGARFDMPANDIRVLLKNGNIVVENDDDVARLTREDYIDVVFGNAMPFEPVPDLVPVYAPFNASLSQIV